MKLISLNAWGGAMFDPLAAWLPDCGADVLCLQEVTHTFGLGGWTSFADGERALPQRASLFNDIKALLPAHEGFFLASDSGPVYDTHKRRHQQEFGIALFVHERYPVVHAESSFVHGGYERHREWPASGRPRIAFGMRLFDPDAGRTVAVTHVHGLRDAAGKGDSPARLAQAQRLAALGERVGQGADVSILCGDLNLLPDSETFTVLRRAGLVDLVGERDTRTSRYEKPVRHANYLLVSDVSAVARFEAVAEPEVSDHRFLELEF